MRTNPIGETLTNVCKNVANAKFCEYQHTALQMLRLAHVCKSLHIWLCTSAHIPANVGANLCTFACTRPHLCTRPRLCTSGRTPAHYRRRTRSSRPGCTRNARHTRTPCGTPEGLPRRGSAPCTPSANSKPRSGGDSSSLQPPRMPRKRANTRKG